MLIDSEAVWDRAREQLAAEAGGSWHDRAQREMMGMSSPEWSRYMAERIGVPMRPERINDEVVARLSEIYRRELPLIPGAVEAVRALAGRWQLGVASSSNQTLIDLVLELAGFSDCFEVAVSSEQVRRGKPAPYVYLEAARRLGVQPAASVAVEDSTNGIRAAHDAGMRVVAIPERKFPPAPESLALASAVLESIKQLTPALIEAL